MNKTKEVKEKMMFYLWCIEKADNFELILLDGYKTVRFIYGAYSYAYRLDDMENALVYPILIQKAIEGVNLSYGDYFIIQYCSYYEVHTRGSGCYKHIDFDNLIDESKESALKYIYEQENK